MSSINSGTVTRLYPYPGAEYELEGLYLNTPFGRENDEQRAWVYTNFIVSLDGRIAIEQPVTGKRGVPKTITNPRDWRLYQELAARADVLLVSARFLRELVRGEAQDNLPIGNDPVFADLLAWRRQHGLTPQPAVVVLSASLDLPLAKLCATTDRVVYVATGKCADAEAVRLIENSGAKILFTGEGKDVDGQQLVEQLTKAGLYNIYSIAGPGVLETLLQGGVLDCIYLTQVHRLIGGASYDTLLGGELLQPPADFILKTLYYDSKTPEHCDQFFSVYEKISQVTSLGCD
ncbi:MAG: dihydrofolate reductase family protein [Gammaproteobacteria bacterium]|nr:dihydrofolate reductase family protein [Gammaproteobacteria bacterium]